MSSSLSTHVSSIDEPSNDEDDDDDDDANDNDDDNDEEDDEDDDVDETADAETAARPPVRMRTMLAAFSCCICDFFFLSRSRKDSTNASDDDCDMVKSSRSRRFRSLYALARSASMRRDSAFVGAK